MSAGGYCGVGAETQTTIGNGYMGMGVYKEVGTPGPDVNATYDHTFSVSLAYRSCANAVSSFWNWLTE